MAQWTVKLHDTIITTFTIADGQTVTIGRGPECEVSIDNTAISRQHLALRRSGALYLLSDLGSTNGTFVNGQRITSDEPVSGADTISFGKFTLVPAVRDDAARQASSVAVAGMPVDEATVFVQAKKAPASPAAQTAPQFKSRAAGPRLTVVQGEATPKELSLAGVSSLKLGKDPSCDLVIPGWLVAKAQAYIVKRHDDYLLVPQRSWAGTYVNQVKVSDERVLRPGDVIVVRGTVLRFD